jgi:hypothetical protein
LPTAFRTSWSFGSSRARASLAASPRPPMLGPINAPSPMIVPPQAPTDLQNASLLLQQPCGLDRNPF